MRQLVRDDVEGAGEGPITLAARAKVGRKPAPKHHQPGLVRAAHRTPERVQGEGRQVIERQREHILGKDRIDE